MEKYQKYINGKSVIKYRDEIVVVKYGMQYINPAHDMLLEDGWLPYHPELEEPSEEEVFETTKNNTISDIYVYDSSSEVNTFYISGMPMWLDKATRVGLMLRFDSEKWAGRTETSLWSNGMKFTLPLDMAIQMLQAIELYASACYDVTQMHIANVMKMDNISDIMSYDYKKDYPEKLNFA